MRGFLLELLEVADPSFGGEGLKVFMVFPHGSWLFLKNFVEALASLLF